MVDSSSSRPKSSSMSPSSFLLMSLGIVTAGTVAGAFYMAKTEPNTVSFRQNPSPVYIALRAFTLGTILCTGSFITVGSFSALALGIRSMKDVRVLMEEALTSKEKRLKKEALLRKEYKEIAGMTASEELDYYGKKFFNYDDSSFQSSNKNSENKEGSNN